MTNAEKFEEIFGVKPVHESDTAKGLGLRHHICPPDVSEAICWRSQCSNCLKWWDEEYVEVKK